MERKTHDAYEIVPLADQTPGRPPERSYWEWFPYPGQTPPTIRRFSITTTALAQLRRLHRGPLACRPASDTNEIGVYHVTYGFWHVRLPQGFQPINSFMVIEGIRMLRIDFCNFDNIIHQGTMIPLKNCLSGSFCS